MPMYKVIESEEDLPPPGADYEKAVIDLKGTYSPDARQTMAIDVAAFANHLGGTILVGADQNSGGKAVYKPLPEEFVANLKRSFEEAIRDRCSPRPIVHPAIIKKDGAYLLAVNVEPFLGLIGVMDIEKESQKQRRFQAYPIRTTTQTVYLYPEQLPMYMSSEIRRTIILLSHIEPNTPVKIFPTQTGHPNNWVFKSMEPERNIFILATNDARPAEKYHPIDLVTSVYPRGRKKDEWIIRMKQVI